MMVTEVIPQNARELRCKTEHFGKKEAKIKTFDKNGEGTVRSSKIIFAYSYRFFNYLSDAPWAKMNGLMES